MDERKQNEKFLHIVPVIVRLDRDLKTKFTTFFKDRNLSFDSALDFLIRDFLIKHSRKNLDKMMNKFQLSKREKEVTLLICKGLKNKEISNRLYISRDTVSSHLKNIYRKCGVTNAVQLVNLLSQNKV